MKRAIILLLTIIMVISLFAGCTDNAEENINNAVASADTSNANVSEVEVTEVNVEYSEEEKDGSFDQSNSTKIYLDNANTSVEGSGAVYKDGAVNILNAGTYVLSGNLTGQVVVNATSVDEVQIVLNNAVITNESGTAIYVRQAENVVLTLADGSVNTITDGSSYSDVSDDAPDAAIFSDDDLTINGNGTLNVEGNYKHGIKCADDLKLVSGTVNVSAVNDGIRGKDSVAILDGYINVVAGGDGITATNGDDSDKGWISVDGGVFNIAATNNGFQAESALIINAGELNVTAYGDTYHCNNDINISGGTSTLDAGDDGMHADNNLQITDGTIDVVSDYEGLEGSNVYISGGNISVEAVDDGINAAGGSDSDISANDRFSAESGDNVIVISGGEVYVSIVGTEGDGLDSNGNIYLSGGNISIDGGVSQRDAAIDINKGTFEYSGGTLTSVGSTAMLVIPTTVSQPVITVIFDSNQQAGETINVTDSSGNTVLTFTPKKTYTVAMLSSPELQVGETYSVNLGSNTLFNTTLDSTSITVDGSGNETEVSMTMPGGRGGGMTGDMGTRPEGDMETPPEGDMGTRPEGDMGTPPEGDMGGKPGRGER